jgi:ABC-type uncharacterized transport system ATPase subunit
VKADQPEVPNPGARSVGAAVSDQPRDAFVISHLRKAYGSAVAVDDVTLSVAVGETFGLLGPNGAGKTTTVECASGLWECQLDLAPP